MTETQALYRDVFRTANDATLLVDGTSRAGIEAALVSLIVPGDRVLVPVFGRFGHLLVEIAERCGAECRIVDAPWGEIVPARIAEAVQRVRPKLVASCTGTPPRRSRSPSGARRDLPRRRRLLYADATATLGGNPFETDGGGSTSSTAGLQKCLGGPSGSAPITFADRGPR